MVQLLRSLAEVIDTEPAVSAALYREYRAVAETLSSGPVDQGVELDALFDAIAPLHRS
jgi:hypothetical protein